MEYKHPFPLHHRQAPTTPSRVFPSHHQLSTTSQCKNQVFPRKTPSQKDPTAHGRHQHPEHGVGKGSPGARGAPEHYRPWNFHFFSGTKQTQCKRQLLPRGTQLHQSSFLINKKKFVKYLEEPKSRFPAPFQGTQRGFIPCSLRRLRVSPTAGMFEWHPLNQGAGESIIPLSPQAGRKRKRALRAPGSSQPRPSAF